MQIPTIEVTEVKRFIKYLSMTSFSQKFSITILFLLLLGFPGYSRSDSIFKFTDYKKIIGFGSQTDDRILKIDSFSIDWGTKVINELKLNGLTAFEKATKIKNYVHKNIKCYGREYNIHDIIKKGKGNCYDHARISIFLLRMAGVPAKFAFEINLRNNVFWWANKAKKQHMGTFGDYHNDHVWVLFYNGDSWQPYDSELNILGINEFVKRRWNYISPFYFRILPFGPPFIIWEDTGDGFYNMKAIAKQVWLNKPDSTYAKVSKSEWFNFLSEFDGSTHEKLEHDFFSDQQLKSIKRMCKKIK